MAKPACRAGFFFYRKEREMTRKIVISLVLVFILSFGPLPRPSTGKASADLQAGFFSAGDLDPEFGEAGKLILPNVTGVNKNSLAIQPDGKLLLAVRLEDPTPGIAILRFLPDGSPDSSFGGDGRVDTSLDGLVALFLQPDGKILVVGNGMERYLPDGNPDTSFGEEGRVSGMGSYPAGLQPDGKIVVSGDVIKEEPINGNNWGIYVARFSTDGSPDPSFGQDGLALDLFTYFRDEYFLGVNGLAVLPDGKIVVVGVAGDDADSDWLIRHFNSDGSPDVGIQLPYRGPCMYCFDGAQAAVVQPDGRLLVVGDRSLVREDYEAISKNFYLVRFNPDASLDASFGEGGEVYTSFPSSIYDVAYDVALQEDGKIVAAGETIFSARDFALARYHPDGSLDESFGNAGLVTTDFGASEAATAVALQPDGKIVAAGDTEGGVALVRYFATTTVPSFPITSSLDNFNRANGRLGSNWKGARGAYRIHGKQVDVRGEGPIYWKDAFGVNQEAYVTLNTVDPGGLEQDLLLKVQGDYGPNWGEGAIEVLYDAAAGTVTVWTFRLDTLDWFSYPAIPVTFANGDQFGAQALATGEVVIFKNSMEVGRVTLNSADQAFFNPIGGHIGLWFIDARNAFFDDFGGGNIPLP
jgi:uncharacterized delta-60 repeat protein